MIENIHEQIRLMMQVIANGNQYDQEQIKNHLKNHYPNINFQNVNVIDILSVLDDLDRKPGERSTHTRLPNSVPFSHSLSDIYGEKKHSLLKELKDFLISCLPDDYNTLVSLDTRVKHEDKESVIEFLTHQKIQEKYAIYEQEKYTIYETVIFLYLNNMLDDRNFDATQRVVKSSATSGSGHMFDDSQSTASILDNFVLREILTILSVNKLLNTYSLYAVLTQQRIFYNDGVPINYMNNLLEAVSVLNNSQGLTQVTFDIIVSTLTGHRASERTVLLAKLLTKFTDKELKFIMGQLGLENVANKLLVFDSKLASIAKEEARNTRGFFPEQRQQKKEAPFSNLFFQECLHSSNLDDAIVKLKIDFMLEAHAAKYDPDKITEIKNGKNYETLLEFFSEKELDKCLASKNVLEVLKEDLKKSAQEAQYNPEKIDEIKNGAIYRTLQWRLKSEELKQCLNPEDGAAPAARSM